VIRTAVLLLLALLGCAIAVDHEASICFGTTDCDAAAAERAAVAASAASDAASGGARK